MTSGTLQPQWFGNLLAVSCATAGGLISASNAILVRQFGEDGVRWEIFNSDQSVEIDLFDHPFSGNNKTVNAVLEVGHGHVNGTCNVVAHDVHGLN